MGDLLPFLIIGVTSGALYGLAGLGLVLTFRTSGIFNFAHGAMAAAAAYLFYELHVTAGVPWPVAAIVTVVLVGVVGGVATERLARSVATARVSMVIVGTVGLLLAVQSALFIRFGAVAKGFPQFLPTSGITVSGVNISYAQMITVAVAVLASAALYGFLRTSRLGITMRAVVDSPELLGLVGTNPARVRTIAWVIGTSFAALSGILIAPTVQLDALLLTLLIVQGFGAVAVGRFRSLPLTFGGGILIGVMAALATKFWGARPPLNGIPTSVPFLVLMAVLLATPARRLPTSIGRPGGAILPRAAGRAGPRALAAVVGVGLLVMLPVLAPARLAVFSNALTFVVMFLSLALLLNTSGQISLAHAAFVAVGATTFSHLTTGLHLPWLLAFLGAGLVAVPVGALLAIPAIRLSGVYLALATFGFGILAQNVVFNTWLMFGSDTFLKAPRPVFALLDGRDDTQFYFFVLAVALLATAAVIGMLRSRLGRLLRAMADAPTALTTQGLNVNVTRVLVFCVSAFLAGICGALFISQFGQITRDSGFGPFQSLIWVAVLTVCGSRVVPASFLAAGLLIVVPSYLTGVSLDTQTLLFGIGALTAAVFGEGRLGWREAGRRWADNSQSRRQRSPVAARTVASHGVLVAEARS